MARPGRLTPQFPALTEVNFALAARPTKGILAPAVYAERQPGRKNCSSIGSRKPNEGAGAPGATVTVGDLGSEVARNGHRIICYDADQRSDGEKRLMTMKQEKSETSPQEEIDDAVVESYFNGAGGTTAASMSMMAHGHNLPLKAVTHRVAREQRIIGEWLDAVPDSGRVLDVGCGAGAWVEIFANRYDNVIGVERSQLMVDAARNRVSHLANAQIISGDVRKDLPDGPFDLIFAGGLFMYLNHSDAVSLLGSLKDRLSVGGSIVLRESGVRGGVLVAKGDYQAVYRSVDLYRHLFQRADIACLDVKQNLGYNDVVMAEELVSFRRRWLPFLPKESPLLGALTWYALRGTAPISFWSLPKVLSGLKVPWPRLQNYFYLLRTAS